MLENNFEVIQTMDEALDAINALPVSPEVKLHVITCVQDKELSDAAKLERAIAFLKENEDFYSELQNDLDHSRTTAHLERAEA